MFYITTRTSSSYFCAEAWDGNMVSLLKGYPRETASNGCPSEFTSLTFWEGWPVALIRRWGLLDAPWKMQEVLKRCLTLTLRGDKKFIHSFIFYRLEEAGYTLVTIVMTGLTLSDRQPHMANLEWAIDLTPDACQPQMMGGSRNTQRKPMRTQGANHWVVREDTTDTNLHCCRW